MKGIVLLILSLLNITVNQGQGVELFEANPTAPPSLLSSDGSHGDAFEHSHEEGDEHVVNKEVCSSQDLPEETIAAYDRCTNFIPVYKVCRTNYFLTSNGSTIYSRLSFGAFLFFQKETQSSQEMPRSRVPKWCKF